MNLPRARRDDLLTTNLDDEVVVYDPERKQAHSLNRVAMAVWNHSDGTKTIEELQRAASEEVGVPVGQGAVWLALSKLEKAHLLLGKVSTAGAMTRRDMLGKAGKYGAAAMATPLIASALVPMAAAATSVCTGGSPGTLGADCGNPAGTCRCFAPLTASGPAATASCFSNTISGTCSTSNLTCATGVCVESDGSLVAGDCRTPCTAVCTC